jgi:hypothetical protein
LITFNLGNKEKTHKTLLGGVISIILKVLIAIYIGMRIKKLAFLEGAETSVNGLLLKVDLHGEVPYESMHL